MVLNKRVVALITTAMSFVLLFLCTTNVQAARADMVDVSNNNGAMTVANFQDMKQNYGIKAIVTKISEGTSFKDGVAAGNIANAQKAGLYVNGYHYAHYSSVAGAIAEADYAANAAKADGLPSGAVLAADVESSEQSASSKAQNDADNEAFMNEVAKYGYRSTIYTMGSWVGTVMTVNSGWIASYPYDPTGQEWYTSNHGWQWSSTYTFNGSYGNFDVSELYDDYFTSYQSPTGGTSTSTTDTSTTTNSGTNSGAGIITVNNQSGSYVPLVALQNDGSMATVENRALSNNTSWKTDKTQDINGVTYYRVATNEWVASSYLKGNNAATDSASDSDSSNDKVIRVSDSSSTYVKLMALQSDGSMKLVENRALANNTPWKTDKTQDVNGVTYYRVATNEWVAANYVIG